MGGNVFPEGITRRYQADEYFELTPKILNRLWLNNNYVYGVVIPAYHEKESFGDCDVLYSTKDDKPIDAAVFGDLFATSLVSRNSEVTSIAYKELQIDCIHIPREQFEYGLNYFRMNDAGNLIGKLAHQVGLKHGHAGLFLPLRDGDNKFAQVRLTLDHDKTLELLGLDVKTFNDGFDNLQQMFEFVASSRYYNPEIYLLENNNTISRVRDRKRDTYRKFLEFGTTYRGPVYEKVADKSVFLEHIFECFPEAYPAYQEAMHKLAVRKFIKEKFNGHIVANLTGVQGKELGQFMQILRADWYFRDENIIYMSHDQLMGHVLEKFNDFKNSSCIH